MNQERHRVVKNPASGYDGSGVPDASFDRYLFVHLKAHRDQISIGHTVNVVGATVVEVNGRILGNPERIRR